MVNYSYSYHRDNKCGQASAPASHMDVSGPLEEEATGSYLPSRSQQGLSVCHGKIQFNYEFLKGETEIHEDKRGEMECW